MSLLGLVAATTAAYGAVRAVRIATDTFRIESRRWERSIEPRLLTRRVMKVPPDAVSVEVANPGGAATDSVIAFVGDHDQVFVVSDSMPAHLGAQGFWLSKYGHGERVEPHRPVEQFPLIVARDEFGQWWDCKVGAILDNRVPPQGNERDTWIDRELEARGIRFKWKVGQPQVPRP